MRVIKLMGVKPEADDWRKSMRYIARISLNRFGWPKVYPANWFSLQQWQFAQEAQRRIDNRLNRPDGAFVYHVGTKEYPHARKFSAVGDSDLLKALLYDVVLWTSNDEYNTIAGYHVLSTDSQII